MQTPATIPDLIAKWDKLVEFSEAAGCGYEAARKMRDRASIAPEHWDKVIAASKEKGVEGINYEWFVRQRANEPSATPPKHGEAA